jgi:hypothetical protein
VEREVLLQVVEDARRRLAARRAWWWGGRVAFAGTAVALVLVMARAVVPISMPYLWMTAAALAAGLLVVGAMRLFSRMSPLTAAQVLDARFACADRLATAVEVLTGRHPATELTDAAVDDAAERAAALDLRRGLPVRPGRPVAAAVAMAAATVIAAGALKGFSLPGTPAGEVTRTIQREGRRLERAGQTLEEQARAERARIARRMAPELQRLGEALQRERLERQDALARLEALGRQIDSERRQVQGRREQLSGDRPPSAQTLPPDLLKQRAAVDRALRQIREIADRLATARTPEEREALMRQLSMLAGGGDDGNVPANVREQAETAQQQMAQGDAAGARRTLQQSASDLDDLRAMLADEEGLHQAQRDVQRSAAQIAQGGPEMSADMEQPGEASARPGPIAPGDRPPGENGREEQTEAPPGPNQGTTPGQGTISEKLGARTARLDAERQQSRVAGLQGEGRMTTSDLLGPGRSAQVRAPAGPAAAAARADADRYIARMRIPPEYREIVRRYFETIAAAR